MNDLYVPDVKIQRVLWTERLVEVLNGVHLPDPKLRHESITGICVERLRVAGVGQITLSIGDVEIFTAPAAALEGKLVRFGLAQICGTDPVHVRCDPGVGRPRIFLMQQIAREAP